MTDIISTPDLGDLLVDGLTTAPLTLVLAHGAGAAMDSPFMNTVAAAIGAAGWRVLRFELPYMRRRREEGRRGAPDPEPVLRRSWLRAIEVCGGPARLAIGGKSMGGRIASLVADEAGVRGLVCLGYPFHPPGQPAKVRTAHLAELRTPALIVQGTRDPFGGPEDVAGYRLSPAIQVRWLEGADHSLAPRRRATGTASDPLGTAVAWVEEFLRAI